MPEHKKDRASTALLGILTTVLVGWVLHVGGHILQPLVIALLLASMLWPVVRGLARFKIPPPVTVVLLATLLFFGLARLGLLMQANIAAFLAPAPEVGASAVPGTNPIAERDKLTTGLGLATGVYVATGSTVAFNRKLTRNIGRIGALDPFSSSQDAISQSSGWTEVLDSLSIKLQASAMPRPLTKFILDSLNDLDLREVATGVIGGGFDFTRGLVLVIIYMLFIFAEQAVFRRKLLSVAGRRRQSTTQILDTIGRGIQRYLSVKTIVSFATAALCYAVLVALNIPYALLFGFLTFLLNYIPTFGSIIAGAFPTITALAVEPTYKAVIVVITYLSVNIVLGSLLEPRILGRELNLSPLVIVISVVVWAGLWGVVGTFLAVPLTAAIQIILASHENTRPIAILLSSGPPKDSD